MLSAVQHLRKLNYPEPVWDCASINVHGEAMPYTCDPTTVLPYWNEVAADVDAPQGPPQEHRQSAGATAAALSSQQLPSTAVSTAEGGLRLGRYVSRFTLQVGLETKGRIIEYSQ